MNNLTNKAIIQELANGSTCKEISEKFNADRRILDHKINVLKKQCNASTHAHLVIIWKRKELID